MSTSVSRRLFGLAALLLLAVAGLAKGDPPLTTADVIRFLRAGISERTVITELESRGFWTALDPASAAFLREAGASETLLTAIRHAAPGAPPQAPSPLPLPSLLRPPEEKPLVPPLGRSGQEPTFAATARTVRVPVSVLDRSGEPVLGLLSADFKVQEEGKRQPVTLFSSDRQPMRIALALDVSGSMEDKIAQVEEALKHFIDILEPKDEIMVLTFNRQVHILQDFTSDREILGNVLTQLQPSGGTALYDAAYEAIRRVAKAPAESKAVVLVSDGVNTASGVTFDELLMLAQKSEVPVFSIGLDRETSLRTFPPPGQGGGRHRPPGGGGGGGGGGGRPGGGGGSFGPPRRPPSGGGPGGGPGMFGRKGFDGKALQELADETGGRAEIITGLDHYTPGEDLPGGGRLKKAVESIASILRHRYLVGYEPPDGKAGWRTIKVEVGRPEGATTRSRKGYFAGK